MVAQRRRTTRRRSVMRSHQRCWLWGRHLVLDTLQAGRWPVLEVQISESLNAEERETVTALAAEHGTPVATASATRLSQLCGARDHQGYLAKVRPFVYAELTESVLAGIDRPAWVMLDRIQDAHNFGAVIRAAEVLGINGLIVGAEGQAEVNSLTARSSAGAVNHVPIVRVPDLVETASELRRRGFSLLATGAHSGTPIAQQDLTGPIVFVLGNEHAGLDETLRSVCDATVHIPQWGQIESLNIAVAAGILFYELRRQRAVLPPTD